MKRQLALVVGLLLAAPACAEAQSSWIFRPSYFSHEPYTGQRVVQYAAPVAPYYRHDATYMQSGYRHSRSSIRVGEGSDHTHVVETWGAGEFIRPYGEWLRPFREGATPFGPWGNPAGPWTTPFGAWANPYGLGRLPRPPWLPYPGFYGAPAYPIVPYPGPAAPATSSPATPNAEP